jgi:hypothetical protein
VGEDVELTEPGDDTTEIRLHERSPSNDFVEGDGASTTVTTSAARSRVPGVCSVSLHERDEPGTKAC